MAAVVVLKMALHVGTQVVVGPEAIVELVMMVVEVSETVCLEFVRYVTSG